MHYFGERLIFNEAPEILPETLHKNKKQISRDKIFSMNKEKWLTLPAAQKEIDDLREDDNKMFSFKSKDKKTQFFRGY